MARDSAPIKRSTGGRGYIVGCLLGLSPLLLLLIVWLALDGRRDQALRQIQTPHAVRESVSFGSVAVVRQPSVPLPDIDPATPAARLLPTPPQTSKAPVYLGEDLSGVPELMLEAESPATADEWISRKAHAAAAALHLDQKEKEGYLKALLRSRPDLAGLPFALGETCRTRGARAKAFKDAANAVRRHNAAALLAKAAGASAAERERFYQTYLAVASQVMGEEDAPGQDTFIRALASIPRPEATRALARLAVFSTDETARAVAIEALAIRRPEDATDALVAGLSYPWPAVAANAARAIAKLKRKDLIPDLKAVLNAPDPRSPRTEVIAGQQEMVAHELVRINHLRNCLVCHAPAERGKTPEETLVAQVPVPTLPLPDTSSGYDQSESTLLVRIDVTYLRPDFSALRPVTDWTAASWSPKQRFDYLVRRRVLTPAEAADLRARLVGVSPYRRAAARALRELTGHDLSGERTGRRSG